MFKNILSKIESKRNHNNIFWRFVVFIKDIFWFIFFIPGRLLRGINIKKNWDVFRVFVESSIADFVSKSEPVKKVHCLWWDDLSPLEKLSVKSWQKNGYEVHMWTYDKNMQIPEGVILEDAEKIMPKESIFKFEGHPTAPLPNGGKGVLSHFADIFQVKLLYEVGGIYTQLDVILLKNSKKLEKLDYLFAPYPPYIGTHIMKFPKGSNFGRECIERIEEARKMDESKKDWYYTLRPIATALKKYKLSRYIAHDCEDLGGQRWENFYHSNVDLNKDFAIHLSNARSREIKNNPVEGSLYKQMLVDFKIL